MICGLIFILPEWITKLSLSDLGSISSLASLLVTIWIAISVRKIKSFYLFTARVPELGRRLRRHSSNLAKYMNDPVSFKERISEEIVAAEVTVTSLQRKLSGREKKNVKDLLTGIRRANKAEFQLSEVREVYLLMIRVNEHLKDLQSDLRWEK